VGNSFDRHIIKPVEPKAPEELLVSLKQAGREWEGCVASVFPLFVGRVLLLHYVVIPGTTKMPGFWAIETRYAA
jgi:hypothetical protein